MQILRKYQLDIIFIFFVLIILSWSTLFGLQYLNVDPHRYEWVVTGPLILLYVIWLKTIREQIRLSERRQLTGKTLAYWITLLITLFLTYSTPLPARDYWSIKTLFIVFTLFLADSYWDFRSITFKSIFKK